MQITTNRALERFVYVVFLSIIGNQADAAAIRALNDHDLLGGVVPRQRRQLKADTGTFGAVLNVHVVGAP